MAWVRTTTARAWHAVRALSPATVLAIGWTVFLVYAFPGQTTWDSASTLIEARTGTYTDNHPPAMTTLWFWAEAVLAGTFGMLVIQSTTLLLGLYLVFRRTFEPRAAAWAAVGVLVFPPVLMPMAFIWHESAMAGFMMLGIGGFVAARPSLRIVGLLAMFGACAVRHDAWIAALPPFLLLFRWGAEAGWLRRLLVAAVAWLLVTLAALGVNRALTDVPKHKWHGTVALHDIVGTLAFVDREVPDAELLELFDGTGLRTPRDVHAAARRAYTPRDAGRATSHPQLAMWHVPEFGLEAMPATVRDGIERARAHLVSTHRGAYLRHRLAVAGQLLGFGSDRSTLAAPGRDFNDPELMRWMGLATGWSQVQLTATSGVSTLARETPLFLPWIYLVLALVSVPLTRRHRDAAALLASGLCLVASLVLTAPGRDYRFVHWLVLCTCVAIVILIARRRTGAVLVEPAPMEAPPLRAWARGVPDRVGRWMAGLSPIAILGIGLLGIVLYAFPGYMSFDSVYQLLEARSGVYSDGHPPAMAVLWKGVDFVIAGPFGILIIQNVTFLAGAFLILRQRIAARAAAVGATLLLWFPVSSATMGVIWKDSMMTGLLMLGTGLLLSPRRGVRLLALVVLTLATAMRHNALAMTFPIVILLFVWNPDHRWWKRYAISIVAWIGITAAAQLGTRALTTVHWHMWHQSLALLDMVGTLRYAGDVPDAELRETLAGTPLRSMHDIQLTARTPVPSDVSIVNELWTITRTVFGPPKDAEQRAAVARAWKDILRRHPGAYLTYRWQVFLQLIQLTEVEKGSPIYQFFMDVQDPYGSAAKMRHSAVPARFQGNLRELMRWFGETPLFTVYLYLFLALALLPFAVRDRETLAILLSALSSEAALFFLTPTTDLRYSFWMLLTTTLAVAMLIARRAQPAQGLRAITTNSL
ncbi:MAG: hypothetical protein M3680_03570 [Myxococcota bacterium]|nr:hypothetical protein [Myxococcota bacterium]